MKTIMLVDDSATMLLSISNILTKYGYAVEKTSTAAEGLKKFASASKIVQDINDVRESATAARPVMQVAEELRKVGTYNDVVRSQLNAVVGETEKAAFDIANRRQTIDGVVTNLNTLVDMITRASNELLAKTETRIEDSRVLIATLDDHIKGRIAAVHADRESVEQMTS